MHRPVVTILLIIVCCMFCRAQKFLPDTIIVEFLPDTLIELRNINIIGINDTREENPHFVRYETRKKYLLIPVDQEFYLTNPLHVQLMSGLLPDTSRKFNYFLEIRRFEIETRKQRFGKLLYLYADIPVYEYSPDTNHYLGTLYYDYLYKPLKKKELPSVATGNLLSKWHTDFKIDLLTVNSVMAGYTTEITPNFIADPKIRSLYLNTSGGFFIGSNWWGIQGEMFFTRPETNIKNRYTSGIIRYINNPDYESFAIGKGSEHFTLRRNRKLMLDADLNLLVGFCKWKDIEKHKPTLYQLFDIELSSVQSILYNPVNSRGITARFGLIENFSYIIEKKLKIQVGVFFGLGFKI